MKEVLMSILRSSDTNVKDFRMASENLAMILASEASSFIKKDQVEIQTPLAKTKGFCFKSDIVLVPILRSGLVLLPAFVRYFENAKIGFVGMARDEKTAIPSLYYKKLPAITKHDQVIVLDPMIATGGSGSAALKILIDAGIVQQQILFVGVIAAQEGVDKIKTDFPNISLTVVAVDEKLNKEKFIVPGLGDFGDRYFGTEETL